MTESRRGVDYVATYLYPWACERNQIKRPESINIDRLRKQLKRKRESFEKSFTRIEMTKEHLNEIMASLCKKLMIDKSDLVAIHEAALVALGIDSNAVPYGLDFLVLRGLGDAGVSKLSIDGFDIRLHAPENFEANGPISLVAPQRHGFPVSCSRDHLRDNFQVSELQVPDGTEGCVGGAAALRRYGR